MKGVCALCGKDHRLRSRQPPSTRGFHFHPSLETRARMSAAMKAAWARRRARNGAWPGRKAGEKG